MGVVAILVMWSSPYEQTFVPPPQRSTCNLVSFDLVVSEEMSFENVDNDGQRTTVYPISSTGAFGSGELKRQEDF